ncbi:MAG: 1-acyl-sn-glycerol-3-phosphate acyltransferase [Dechloromonas sp.]|nr:1-acyl-sn-glycerol-3-phosphate acyltransferase [Dechloromonas sp.]
MTECKRGRGHLWSAYEYVAMVVGLGFLALICLLWLPFAMILHPLLPRRWGQPLGRFMIMAGFRTYLRFLTLCCACRFELSALDGLRHEGPLIVVANHPSLLDAVMILSRLPNAVCVMKAGLMDNILFGAAARLARYIRNDAPLNLILDARAELRQGAQLVIFPEGTRTTTFPIDPLLPTAGVIAARTGTPVQALYIAFSSPYLGKGWPLFGKPELPLDISVRRGQRFAAQKDACAFTVLLEECFRRELGTSGASTATNAIAQ